jgi:hypothetical protein
MARSPVTGEQPESLRFAGIRTRESLWARPNSRSQGRSASTHSPPSATRWAVPRASSSACKPDRRDPPEIQQGPPQSPAGAIPRTSEQGNRGPAIPAGRTGLPSRTCPERASNNQDPAVINCTARLMPAISKVAGHRPSSLVDKAPTDSTRSRPSSLSRPPRGPRGLSQVQRGSHRARPPPGRSCSRPGPTASKAPPASLRDAKPRS